MQGFGRKMNAIDAIRCVRHRRKLLNKPNWKPILSKLISITVQFYRVVSNKILNAYTFSGVYGRKEDGFVDDRSLADCKSSITLS